MNMRQPNFPIDPIFVERWSPRAFTGEEIPDNVLSVGFEAARWAPSSMNSQPWQFVYATNDSPQWKTFVEFLIESNRVWAQKASALIVLLSKKTFEREGKVMDAPASSFDAGAAWMSFALQLKKLGWVTHAMGGIQRDLIRTTLNLPENLGVEVVIAVGKMGDAAMLPEALRLREVPSHRSPLEAIVNRDHFKDSK